MSPAKQMSHSQSTTMRIAYYSLDEVNRLLVRQWARRQHVRLVYPSVAAVSQPATAGKIVDLDFLPEPIRGDWLSQAIAGLIDGPVLVHGHCLTDAQVRSLSRRGIMVCQGRLRRRMLREWIGAMSDTHLMMS
jgi:hypothetical protein